MMMMMVMMVMMRMTCWWLWNSCNKAVLLNILLALGHFFVECLLVRQIYAAGSWLHEPRTCCMGCRACCMLHKSFFLLHAGGCGIIEIRLVSTYFACFWALFC